MFPLPLVLEIPWPLLPWDLNTLFAFSYCSSRDRRFDSQVKHTTSPRTLQRSLGSLINVVHMVVVRMCSSLRWQVHPNIAVSPPPPPPPSAQKNRLALWLSHSRPCIGLHFNPTALQCWSPFKSPELKCQQWELFSGSLATNQPRCNFMFLPWPSHTCDVYSSTCHWAGSVWIRKRR